MDQDLINDVLIPAFWYTAEQIAAQLFVPLIVLILIITLTTDLLFNRR